MNESDVLKSLNLGATARTEQRQFGDCRVSYHRLTAQQCGEKRDLQGKIFGSSALLRRIKLQFLGVCSRRIAVVVILIFKAYWS